MNRRTFLLAVGATACGGPREDVHSPRPSRPAHDGSPPRPLGPELYEHQWDPSPLAVRGDVLVQAAKGELWKWDALAMKRVDIYALARVSHCYLQDGSLAVFAVPAGSDCCVLHRVDDAGHVTTLFGPTWLESTSYHTRVLPARGPDEVYLVRERDALLARVERGRIEDVAEVDVPQRTPITRHQRLSLGDGRLVVGGDGLDVVAIGAPAVHHPMPKRSLRHLARASGDRVWYSYASRNETPIDRLVLAPIAAPMDAVQHMDLAPGHLVHVASGGDVAAALVFTLRGTTWADAELTWEVLVIGETGTIRWRTALPATVTSGRFTELNRVAFLAVTEHRVVLRAFDHALLAWDLANGAAAPPA